MLPTFALALLLAAATATPAPVPLPEPGIFAFNWLDPHSQCRKLAAKDLRTIKSCERSDYAFDAKSKSLMCKVNAKVELMVYDTAAQCQEGLEAMLANGD